VGTLLDYAQAGAGAQVLAEIDGDVVQFFVSNTADPLILPQGQTVWFSDVDCAGQAYAAAPNEGTVALAGVLAGAFVPNVFYFAPAGTVAVLPTPTPASRAFFAGGCTNDPGTLPPGLFPVSVSPDPLSFTPPFTVVSFRPILAAPAAVPGLERWSLFLVSGSGSWWQRSCCSGGGPEPTVVTSAANARAFPRLSAQPSTQSSGQGTVGGWAAGMARK
jgi:hypothetical protein